MHADTQERGEDLSRLRGHVQITFRGMKLTADEVTYNEASGEIVATGHVLFLILAATSPPMRSITTSRPKRVGSKGVGYFHSNRARPKQPQLENPYYIQTDRSKILYSENPLYIQGEEIDRLDESTYTVKHGKFTTCDCERKGSSFSAGSAKGGSGR